MVSKRKASDLNPEQLAAVNHGEGPLLIIAGAGTGKTTVVTERIKRLILKDNISPNEILALTFTEKAAREMEERVDVALPYGYTQMWIMTFHSFCDRVLRDQALHIGLDPRYRLMSEAEAVQLIRTNLFDFNLNYFRPLGNPNKFISGMLQHFSRLQDEDISPQDYLSFAKKLQISKTPNLKAGEKIEKDKTLELAKAYRAYDELKVKKGLMDFGDLIVKTLKLFRDRPNVLARYREQFKYILVDEYQDTNYAQNELVKLMAGAKANVTVVADDDQSIYRFRGAAVSNVIQFRSTFPKTKIVVLTKNYRSTQEILDRSYDLIQNNNPDRLEVVEKIDKKLTSERGEKGRGVGFIHTDRVENEADAIAKKIQELMKDEGYKPKDFAILVRANNHSEPLMRGLARHAIPYQFLGPGRLFKQPEVIDLVSYLKVLYNFEDSVAFYRLLSMDHFNISPRDMVVMGNYGRKLNMSLFEVCEHIDDVFVRPETKEQVKKIVGIIGSHLKLLKEETAGQLLYYFLEGTGILQKMISPDTPGAQKKAANISKFFDKLKSYEVDHEDASVRAVVDWIELASELGESPLAADSDWTDVDAVNILTIHSAKGLEFPVVFLPNLVSQRFPTTERREQIPIPEGIIKEVLPVGDYHLEEERRLFYVGMTRARNRLFLTAADYYGEGKREKKLSPFIFEALGDTAISAELKTENLRQLSFLDYGPASLQPTAFSIPQLHIDYLSYSQIETFKICPLHYKLRYILKIPTPANASLSFGSSVHATLKNFYLYTQARKEKPTERLLFKVLAENWIQEGFASKKHEEKYLDKAKEMLVAFVKKDMQEKKKPLVFEMPFTVPLTLKDEPYIKIGGKIDRIDELPDGKIEIIDYKTGAAVPPQREVDKNLQLTFYALAATKINESFLKKDPKDVLLTLYYFENQEKVTTTRTTKNLEDAVKEIFEARKRMETSDFACSGHIFCQNCEYNLFCRSDLQTLI